MHQPVLWRRSIERVLQAHPGAALVEVGPKRVLFNLLDRKWQKGVAKFHCDDADDPRAHLDQTIASLRKLIDAGHDDGL